MDNKAFLGKRRDRAIATLLSFKERECDVYLPSDVSQKLRKEILDQINEVCDVAFDIISDDIIVNEIIQDKLNLIYESVIRKE
jgi:hypothetical protein